MAEQVTEQLKLTMTKLVAGTSSGAASLASSAGAINPRRRMATFRLSSGNRMKSPTRRQMKKYVAASSRRKHSLVKLNFSQMSFHGRKEELEQLDDALNLARKSNTVQVVFLQAQSGAGKSFLVKEFCKRKSQEQTNTSSQQPLPTIESSDDASGSLVLDDDDGNDMSFDTNQFISCHGKYDQISFGQPFSAIQDAFHELVENILALENSTIRKNILKNRLNKVFDADALSLLRNAVPNINVLLDNQKFDTNKPEQQASQYQEQHNIKEEWLFESLKRLVCVFLSEVSAIFQVAIFIDDLQWSGESGINLLKQICLDTQIGSVLLILAFRNNDVQENHPFLAFQNKLTRGKKQDTHTITVQNLKLEDTKELIMDISKMRSDRSLELANVIHAKTHGNPLHTIEFLRMLENEKLLTYGCSNYSFEFDAQKILQSTDLHVPRNVLDLMASRLKTLPKPTQEALSIGACLGHRFDAKTVTAVLYGVSAREQHEELIMRHLDIAVREELVNFKAKARFYKFR